MLKPECEYCGKEYGSATDLVFFREPFKGGERIGWRCEKKSKEKLVKVIPDIERVPKTKRKKPDAIRARLTKDELR